MKKKLSLSNKFFSSYFVKGVKSLAIDSYGIVTNLGKKPIRLKDKSSIKPYKSYLFKNYSLSGIDKVLLNTFEFDPARTNPDLNKFVKDNWNDNKVRYPDNPEKWGYKILMSPKDKIDGIEFNAWYLPANTASSIHREHPFPKEVHTQIYGFGIMNKYRVYSLVAYILFGIEFYCLDL